MSQKPNTNVSVEALASASEAESGEHSIGDIIGLRLQQDDVAELLSSLSIEDRDLFTDKLGSLLRRASALLEVSRRLSESLELDILLPRMVKTISGFMRAERCTIFLYDSETNELFSRVAQGEEVTEIRFPANVGIAGYVFTGQESLNIPDAYADSRFNQEVDKKTGYRTNNILCVPIVEEDNHHVGVVQVLNKSGGFNSVDVNLLESIAAHAASAFANAQIHEQISKAREHEAQILEVTTAISRELQLGPLLRRVMDAVTKILTADRSTLFLYDEKSQELWSHVAQGIGVAEIRFPSHLGIAGSVFTQGKTINIPDAYADSRFNPAVDKKTGYRTKSILCMPVQTKTGQNIGVIQVLNKRGGPFRSIDESRLRAFSSQVSIAIENAKLFEEVMRVKNYNESILQSMNSGVITLDAEGTIVKANRAALDLLELSDDAGLLGKSVHEYFGANNEWLNESLERVAQTDTLDVAMDTDLWIENVLPTGEKQVRPLSVNLSMVPITNDKSERIGFMMMIEDITTEKRLRGTMARYMTKELADKLLEDGDNALGGSMQNASVFFSDIRDFTAISEELGAQETVAMLNEYFSIMVDIILEKGGILDKYIGDAMMAVFGVPFSGTEDADNAVQAGIKMLIALQELNARREELRLAPIRMGIGINTDNIVSGNIGSIKRMDYTVIGDGVNLAARLESANKYFQTEMLLSEFTVNELKSNYFLREVDKVRVKGKQEPVSIYAVLDHLMLNPTNPYPEVLAIHNDGLSAYRSRDWGKAIKYFDRIHSLLPQDGVSQVYLDRCRYFYENPPPSDWDGVWVMETK